MTTTATAITPTAREDWLAIRAQYAAAINAYGWDDPRTIALEDAEAEACERYAEAEACERYLVLGGE